MNDKKYSTYFIASFFIFAFNYSSVKATELKIYTEIYAPFNYLENGEITGFSTEILQALLSRTKTIISGGEILIEPWSRAYSNTLKTSNAMLFTTTRLEQREHLFKWVGPIYNREQWLFKLRNRQDLKINSIEAVREHSIVVTRESANHKLLVRDGFDIKSKLQVTTNPMSKIRMLLAKRVDLAPFVPIEVPFLLNKIGKNTQLLQKVIILSNEYDYYLAFNKDVPDDIVNTFQEKLDDMKSDGNYDLILARYF